MNILTVSHDFSLFRFRPDSTLIRAEDSYYIPDYVKGLKFAPVICFRCRRPGKCVEEKFAGRYLDSFGYGLFLYPELSGIPSPDRDFISCALDFTSLIPLKFHPMSDYGAISGISGLCPTSSPLRAEVNGIVTVESPAHPSYGRIWHTVSEITRYTSIRTGDFISFELAEPMDVAAEDKITLHLGDSLLTGVTVL